MTLCITGLLLLFIAIFRNPEHVMRCVLSEGNSNDISVQIQHTLIQAYCWENEISVHKVGPQDKLSAILANGGSNMNKNIEDYSCALVMMSNNDTDIHETNEQDQWIKSDVLLPG